MALSIAQWFLIAAEWNEKQWYLSQEIKSDFNESAVL